MCKMNLLKEFQIYISKELLFEPKHKLLLALSGGVDSMVLLHLLKQCKYDVSCAHVNFQLRAEESTADASFVKNYCGLHHTPYYEKKFETKQYALAAGIGTQEAARILRYQWFNELVQTEKFDYVLTAHHANDQAETILFHLIRGAGAKGLSGILPKNKTLVRPLLFAHKQEILNYAQLNAIPFRTDASNESDDYSRNYIRHHLIPKIQQIQTGFIATMQHSSKLMQATDYYFKQQLKAIELSLCHYHTDETHIEVQKLLALPFPEFVLYEIIAKFGFNFSQCEQIIEACKNANVGSLFLANTYRLLLNRNQLIIRPEPIPITEFKIDTLPCIFNVGNTSYELSLASFSGFEKDSWWLNPALITFPLFVKPIKPGDKFIPLGLTQKQKISDYLINKKIDRFSKAEAFTIWNGNSICFLGPYQISNDFKLGEDPQIGIKITLKKEG